MFSTCGYPTASIVIKNASNIGEFDVAYASADLLLDRELSFMNDTDTIKWSGSYISFSNSTSMILANYDNGYINDT